MTGINQKAQLKTSQTLAFGAGNMGINTAALIVASWAFKRYCPPEKDAVTLLPILWASIVYTIAKLTDGTAGPFIGFWSDRVRSRWGRRLPFIVIGSLPMCVVFMMIWVPPTGIFPPGSPQLFAYYTICLITFWLLFTAVQTPLFALLPEIAVTSSDRMNLATVQSLFIMLSSIIAFVGAPIIKASFGFTAMGAFYAILIFICMYLTPLFINEKYEQPDNNSNLQKSDDKFFKTLQYAFMNKPFAIYLASKLFAQIGFQLVIMALLYIVPTIFNKPDNYIGIIMTGTMSFTIISFFVIKKLCKTIDKRTINIWGMILMVILLPSIYFMGRFDLGFSIAVAGNTIVISELVIGLIIFTTIGFSVATQAVLMSPIIADSTDLDEIETGNRREAVYFGLHGMVLKYGTALAGLVMGLLFNKFGYAVGDHLGVDLIGPAAAFFILIGLIIFLLYPIDREKELWIQNEIDKRRNIGDAGECVQ